MKNFESINWDSQEYLAIGQKKRFIILTSLLIIISLLSGLVGYFVAYSANNLVSDEDYNKLKLINMLDIDLIGKFDLLIKSLAYAEQNYYLDIDYDRLDKIAALAVMNGLDDFTSMTSYNDHAINSSIIVGLGIRVTSNMYNEHTISHIFPKNTASGNYEVAQPLLKRGDMIYAINGNRVNGANIGLISYYLLGNIGTQYTLTVIRDDVYMDVVVTKLEYVNRQSYYINNLGGGISDDMGYISLQSFTGSAAADFKQDIEQFLADGNKALILDLRGNPGGSSTILTKIASYLVKDTLSTLGALEKNVPLIEFNDIPTNTVRTFKTDDATKYINKPIYVISDRNTASSSEALIGAMLYYNTGITIGANTYGKGVGQSTSIDPIVDNDGESYSVTMVSGFYYIYTHDTETYPDGKYTIHNIGIEPMHETNVYFTINLYDDDSIIKAMELYSS